MTKKDTTNKMWVLTRNFHYAGLDEPEDQTLGTFTTRELAHQAATVENLTYSTIADDCIVEEVDVNELPELAEDEVLALLWEQTSSTDEIVDDVAAALDAIWPEWRERYLDRPQVQTPDLPEWKQAIKRALQP